MLKLLSQRKKGHRLQSLPENSRCIIVTDQKLLPWTIHHSELRFLRNDEFSLVTAKLAKTGDLNMQMTTRDQNIHFSGEKESLNGLSEQVTGSNRKAGKPLPCSGILWVPWASGDGESRGRQTSSNFGPTLLSSEAKRNRIKHLPSDCFVQFST